MERRHNALARGGVKPGHFRGRTFSKSDSKRDGRGCSRWRFTQRFGGLYSSREEQAPGGAGLWAEPGHDRQDVPVFGASRLSAVQGFGTAEARTEQSIPGPLTAPPRGSVCANATHSVISGPTRGSQTPRFTN